MNEIDTQENEIYMDNAKILRWGPNTNYISLTGLALGVKHIFAFLDTNMLVSPM